MGLFHPSPYIYACIPISRQKSKKNVFPFIVFNLNKNLIIIVMFMEHKKEKETDFSLSSASCQVNLCILSKSWKCIKHFCN